VPELSKIEKTFAFRLRATLEGKKGNWDFQELHDAIYNLTLEKSISASQEYRKKTQYRLAILQIKGNFAQLLKYAWNIIMDADGFGVI
jgi:hypothetical protein